MTYIFFFFNDTATTEIYTLSLHDALPIYIMFPVVGMGVDVELVENVGPVISRPIATRAEVDRLRVTEPDESDRKSTRLNSSHDQISYAVFCLKKKIRTHYK